MEVLVSNRLARLDGWKMLENQPFDNWKQKGEIDFWV
jgi:hypothetical protein